MLFRSNDKNILSPATKQVYEWFLDRLHLNCNYTSMNGIMGNNARRFAQMQIEDMCEEYGNITVNYNDIFDQKFRT